MNGWALAFEDAASLAVMSPDICVVSPRLGISDRGLRSAAPAMNSTRFAVDRERLDRRQDGHRRSHRCDTGAALELVADVTRSPSRPRASTVRSPRAKVHRYLTHALVY